MDSLDHGSHPAIRRCLMVEVKIWGSVGFPGEGKPTADDTQKGKRDRLFELYRDIKQGKLRAYNVSCDEQEDQET